MIQAGIDAVPMEALLTAGGLLSVSACVGFGNLVIRISFGTHYGIS